MKIFFVKLKLKYVFFLLLILSFLPLVYARAEDGKKITNFFTDILTWGNNYQEQIAYYINLGLGFLAIVTLAFFVKAGYLWMVSNGNMDKINRAKRMIGAASVVMAIIIVLMVVSNLLIDKIKANSFINENNAGNTNEISNESGMSCDGNPKLASCQPSNDICASALGEDYYCNSQTCSCSPKNIGSCYNSISNKCDLPCHIGLSCLSNDGYSGSESGNSCLNSDSACSCCCDTENDKCNLLSDSLTCRGGKAPCDGENRGLCCGCQTDSECGSDNGCGSDACCRERPQIISNIPDDKAIDICQNPLIRIEFDQILDYYSIDNSVLLITDYENLECPAGTENFTENNKTGHNYCEIKGATSIYNKTNHSIVTFSPEQLLASDKLYYVLVKGAGDKKDQEGIRNNWGIGYNPPFTDQFSSLDIKRANIFSFRTRAKTDKDNSVLCEVNQVFIEPKDYRFNSIENSKIEDDENISSFSFNSVADRDVVVSAFGVSADKQFLVPIPGIYDWDWQWESNNIGVIKLLQGKLKDNQRLAVAQEGRNKKKSFISASLSLKANKYNFQDNLEGNIISWVFKCDNPWPPDDPENGWSPWIDSETNCQNNSENCFNTNIELFYCRDSVDSANEDKLPSLEIDTPIVGASDKSLKEVYFSRQDDSARSLNLVAQDNKTGGSVTLRWSKLTDSGVAGYKIYWGRKSSYYKNFKDVGNVNEAVIDGLVDGVDYYFNILVYYNTGEEGKFLEEVKVVPSSGDVDIIPVLNLVSIHRQIIEFNWKEIEGAKNYVIYYGTSPGVYIYQKKIQSNDAVISNLRNRTTYYFAVKTELDGGILSEYSNEVEVTTK